MKIIPFSSSLEFQQQTYRTIRSTSYTELALWSVCALSGLIGVCLSFCQITPDSVRMQPVNAGSIVSQQPALDPICTQEDS